MGITFNELQMYRNFDELAADVLDLAKEVLPDKLIYLTSFSEKQQMILKLSDEDTSILLTEGMVIDLEETACNRIDFERKEPLVYEDIRNGVCSHELRSILEDVNIRSYLGIPIALVNGDRFGTLCVAHHEKSQFDEKSIDLLQRIAKMFSYYLELERFANRDSLTQLYNRHYLTRYFEVPAKTDGVLFFLDLDGFKKVNDVYGHEKGDWVLKEVGERLQKLVNTWDAAFAVRLGGDEFILHFAGLVDRAEIEKLAQQLLEALSNWDNTYQLSTSIGIVTYYAEQLHDLTALLKDADTALYEAKTTGKNGYRFYRQQ